MDAIELEDYCSGRFTEIPKGSSRSMQDCVLGMTLADARADLRDARADRDEAREEVKRLREDLRTSREERDAARDEIKGVDMRSLPL